MAIDTPATAGFALFVSIIALHLLSSLDQSTTTTLAPAAPLNSALQVLLPLAAMAGLVTAVAFIYGHMHRVAGAGNRRISEVVSFVLCLSAVLLSFSLFVQQPAKGTNDAAQAQALGELAVRALPAAATATFFFGTMLIYAYVGKGVGVGGSAFVAGDDEPASAPAVRLLSKITLGSAATVVISLIVMAFSYK